ncbi:signal peptidase : Periplasmic serine protease OS=Planctomyces maris DSM 8797 GN=PM8797T_20079 PE=4 SV=1: Peptidase_S49: Peptidase_S49 [Gemmata massiliana]|uniref:Peptidase S49 domain-containing protein n=1 Tax=Gemmata massiliana TaxID=1210884 RepID=A0A6P2D0V4_9BACT|nr:signal peptide peptidase SppA [Gemmata massiliana]VTR94753.1 signal peptidase : Periplasmic serine protease OS=Planctomyces maris DSM 8797 GN=PM8797T_20079 PE=4 SV=1: Peptidase_S49: Peptidase_S49 [Gemmata massiliana]
MPRLLFALVLLFQSTIAVAQEPKKEAPAAPRVAHIVLGGDMDEGAPADGPFGGGSETLRQKIDRIKAAAKDKTVAALYLRLDELHVGFGKVNELRRAVADFRATGKKAFAYAEEFDTKAYLVALACDTISVPESGGLNMVGLRAEVSYYKDALKLATLDVDVLKMGGYKSAVEPFLRADMSPENREQITSMMNDNFDKELVAALVTGRPNLKLTPATAEALVDEGPFTARKALKLGLVDALQYEDQFEAGFAKALGRNEVKIVTGYGKPKKADSVGGLGALMDLMSPKKKSETKEPKVAVIHVVGAIASGKGGFSLLGGQSVGSDTIVEAIRDAEKNPTVKAIVLRVDSPGGSALASDVIWRALAVCKKPVVASMGDVAASGGYYVCMNARRIFAEPGTVTGSIGVFGMKIVTGKLEERVGVTTHVISRGKNTGVNSATFKWSESERKAMTEVIEEVYDQFTDKAVAGRVAAGQKQMTKAKLLELAGGRVWTGRQAKANGLVDELGTLDDAIAFAKKEAGIDPSKDLELLMLPKGSSFFDKLMDGDLDLPFGRALADLKNVPGGAKAMQLMAPVLNAHKAPVQMLIPFHVEFK